MKELKDKVPWYARFVFQEAHRDIRMLDGLILDDGWILDGGRWVQKYIDAF